MIEQKGITLVALIITIVVLMILAGVAISAIQDNGILGYAENAATAWNEAQKNEAGIISGYEEYLANMGKCAHNWSNGKCTKCDLTCAHTEGTVERLEPSTGGRTHYYGTYCKVCNKYLSTRMENCVITVDGEEIVSPSWEYDDMYSCNICDGVS